MTAAMILSALVVSIASGWVVADRETSNLITRQKAIFIADAEMERLTTLYGTTAFGLQVRSAPPAIPKHLPFPPPG